MAELWVAHGVLMVVGVGLLLPLGIGLALIRNKWHATVQVGGATLALVALGLAIGAEHGLVVGDEQPTKRHAGADHDHAGTHVLLGLFMISMIVGQLGFGWLLRRHKHRRANERLSTASHVSWTIASLYGILENVHVGSGYSIVVLAWTAQIYLGVGAYFDLCADHRSGFDQCVGHAVPSAALLVAAVCYVLMDRAIEQHSGAPYTDLPHIEVLPNTNAPSQAEGLQPEGLQPEDLQTLAPLTVLRTRRRARLYIIENAVALVAALGGLVYSVQSEWPYATTNHRHHLAVLLLLALSATATLVLLSRRTPSAFGTTHVHSDRETLPTPAAQGAAIIVAGAGGAIIFAMHQQLNAYAAVMHQSFALLLLGAALARTAQRLDVLAGMLTTASVVFMGSQQGFALIWQERLPVPLPLIVVLAIHLLLSNSLIGFGTLWTRWFLTPHLHARA